MLKETLNMIQTAERDAETQIADAKKTAADMIADAQKKGEAEKAALIAGAAEAAEAALREAVSAGEQKLAAAREKDTQDVLALKSEMEKRTDEAINVITDKILGR